jgi:hypothetical protein
MPPATAPPPMALITNGVTNTLTFGQGVVT